jgi:hypothetical protein
MADFKEVKPIVLPKAGGKANTLLLSAPPLA